MIDVHVLPDLANFIPQIVATGVLFLVLRHFLFGPVTDILDSRSEEVVSNLEESTKEKKEAQAVKAEYELKLEDAKGEAREIVESSKKRSEQLKEEILQEAREEAQKVSEKAMLDIEREKQVMLASLKSEVVDIAMLAANKVVEKDLDPNTHKVMIDQFIDEVGESQWKN